MFFAPQQTIVCDMCSFDETFELYEMGEHEWQLDTEEVEKNGWLIVGEECYCSDCKEEVTE